MQRQQLSLGRPIGDDDRAKRLDVYLTEHYRFLKRAQWQDRIQANEVLVNGERCKPSYRLRCNDTLSMGYPVPAAKIELEILYQDENFIAVNKPSGIPCQPNSHYRLANLKYCLQKQLRLPYVPVHRLDLETSGIVLCAAKRRVIQIFGEMFQQRKIHKKYLAVVNNIPQQKQWTVDAPIGDAVGSAIRIKKWVNPKGKEAITHFRLLEKQQNTALIEAVPITGRSNQIRIHLASCGHHIVGDKLYHPNEEVFLNYYVNGLTPYVLAQTRSIRLCLHCSELGFINPF